MRITRQAIRSFNLGLSLTYNDAYNIANNLGTRAERAYLEEVKIALFPYTRRGVTRKDLAIFTKLSDGVAV